MSVVGNVIIHHFLIGSIQMLAGAFTLIPNIMMSAAAINSTKSQKTNTGIAASLMFYAGGIAAWSFVLPIQVSYALCGLGVALQLAAFKM